MADHEKLSVSELNVGYGKFWRIFEMESIKSLTVTSEKTFWNSQSVRNFSIVLLCCYKIEQFKLELTLLTFDFRELFENIEALPHFKKIMVKL